jgi:hypothetical protein
MQHLEAAVAHVRRLNPLAPPATSVPAPIIDTKACPSTKEGREKKTGKRHHFWSNKLLAGVCGLLLDGRLAGDA